MNQTELTDLFQLENSGQTGPNATEYRECFF